MWVKQQHNAITLSSDMISMWGCFDSSVVSVPRGQYSTRSLLEHFLQETASQTEHSFRSLGMISERLHEQHDISLLAACETTSVQAT